MPIKKTTKKVKAETKPDSEKQLVVVKQQVTRATHAAEELKITNVEELKGASDLLGKIQAVVAYVKKEKDGFTRPAYRAYKEIMERAKEKYDPLLEDCSIAEKIVKDKAIQYRNKAEAEAAKKQAEIERKAAEALAKNPEKEDQIMAKASEKMAGVAVVGTKVEGDKGGGMVFKKVKVIKILNEQEIPRQYLVPDMAKIKADALAGVTIPGVSVVEEDQASGSHRFG